jgi:hypothetical protein
MALPRTHAEVVLILSSALLSSQINGKRPPILSRSENKLIKTCHKNLVQKTSTILGLHRLINMIRNELLIFMKQEKVDVRYLPHPFQWNLKVLM